MTGRKKKKRGKRTRSGIQGLLADHFFYKRVIFYSRVKSVRMGFVYLNAYLVFLIKMVIPELWIEILGLCAKAKGPKTDPAQTVIRNGASISSRCTWAQLKTETH